MMIAENWQDFLANTGIDEEPAAKALYFSAFSDGWAAAIQHLVNSKSEIREEMAALRASLTMTKQ
jgi:hypothetical protein